MSYTPLNLNVVGSFTQNTGLKINGSSAAIMGSSTSLSNYTVGTLISGTCLNQLTSAIRLGYTLLQASSITNTQYNNLIAIGAGVIPALGNSKPTTYTRTYTGELTSYGFLRLVPLQAYREFYLNNGSYKDFVSTFTTCASSVTQHNELIKALSAAPTFLDGTYSNMNDLITSDITGVSISTLYWGQDLIKSGRAIDLQSISTFGNPDNLLRTLYVNKAISKALNLALLAAGLTATELTNIYSGTPANPDQQRLIYASFCLILAQDLTDVLIPLNCQTENLESLADLLDPRKLFPTSYQTLTVPKYNGTPGPTNSKTYYLIYKNGSVNKDESLGFGDRLKDIIPSDLAFVCDAFSNSMMQITNIQNMNIEKFSQVVTNLETTSGLGVNGTSTPTNKALATAGLNAFGLGSNSDGTYNMCDCFGSMTDLHYNWAEIQKLITSIQTPALVSIYTSIYNLLAGAGPYTSLDTLIGNANTEISNILSSKPTVAAALNTLYNQFGTYLTKEQNARDLFLGDTTELVSTNSMIASFITNVTEFASKTESKGPALVLESISDTTTIGGNSLIGSMREARNATRLGYTGGVLNNEVNNDPLVLPVATGTKSIYNVPIITGAAVVPGSLAGSPETTLIPPNLSIFGTRTAVVDPVAAVQEVITCNCDCWDNT
jgi:hypothetical protein